MIILVFPKSQLELLLRDKCVVCYVVVIRKKSDDASQDVPFSGVEAEFDEKQ